MLRRLHPEQPDSFAFTPANQTWAEAQISKYPEGRQASAIIPLLWRAQEQEGWLSRPAIEHVAQMLDLAYIRALEVATFYFMFQLQPVGTAAHIQICGTTSCMICGAEDLMAVCKEKIAQRPHEISEDGKLSWEEVECLGACANAPMAQVGKDYYEDLTAERFGEMIEAFRKGEAPTPGPQNGRYAAEPLGGVTSLAEYVDGRASHNASAALAEELGDTIKRIDGTEVPVTTPWLSAANGPNAPAAEEPAAPVAEAAPESKPEPEPETETSASSSPASHGASAEGPAEGEPGTAADAGSEPQAAATASQPSSVSDSEPARAPDGTFDVGTRPTGLETAREGKPDDLKKIKGVGPKMERLCNSLGFFHFDQIAAWTADEVAWVDANLEGFKGRVTRDDWVAQAATLARGEEPS